MIHTVKGFGIVNKAEIDVFLELSCFFDDPADVGNLISAFSKTSLNIWEFTVHVLLIPWPLGSSKGTQLCRVSQDPKDSKESPLYAPGTQVLIKVWKDGSSKAQLQHMEGPLPCNTFYPHSSQGTRTWLLDSLLTSQAVEENRRGHSIHLWAPGDLRYLFRTTNECHSYEHHQN